MSKRITLKFTGDEAAALQKFAADVGISQEELLRKCLYKCLREAYYVIDTPATEEVSRGTPGHPGSGPGGGIIMQAETLRGN